MSSLSFTGGVSRESSDTIANLTEDERLQMAVVGSAAIIKTENRPNRLNPKFKAKNTITYETPIGVTLALEEFFACLRGTKGCDCGRGYGNIQETISWMSDNFNYNIRMDGFDFNVGKLRGDLFERLQDKTFVDSFDFFVTNPPFVDMDKWLQVLVATGKTLFVMMQVAVIYTKYFKETIGEKSFLLLLPPFDFISEGKSLSIKNIIWLVINPTEDMSVRLFLILF